MMRVISVVSAAREAIRMSRSYGNPDLIYSLPSTAVPPLRASQKRESTLAIRDVDPPSGKSTLAVRTSLDVPQWLLESAARVEILHTCFPHAPCYITLTQTTITPFNDLNQLLGRHG